MDKERVLKPSDKGFEEAARKYGLYFLKGHQEPNGLYVDKYQSLEPTHPAFEEALKQSLDGEIDAIVIISGR